MNKDFKNCHYTKNFLTNVIFRLDFPPNDEAVNQNSDKFRHAIKELLPVYEENKLVRITTIINQNAQPIEDRKELPSYTFKSSNNDKVVTLSYEALTVEFTKYKDLVDFNSTIQKILDAFLPIFTSFDFSRLGIRYINQIVLDKGHPLIWKDLIDNSLIHVIDNFFDRDPSLSRAISQITLNKDDFKVSFTYGMFNSEFPAKISRKEFVLDYDCYTEYVESDKIMACVYKFNNEIKMMFENSIKNGLRKIMGVINE